MKNNINPADRKQNDHFPADWQIDLRLLRERPKKLQSEIRTINSPRTLRRHELGFVDPLLILHAEITGRKDILHDGCQKLFIHRLRGPAFFRAAKILCAQRGENLRKMPQPDFFQLFLKNSAKLLVAKSGGKHGPVAKMPKPDACIDQVCSRMNQQDQAVMEGIRHSADDILLTVILASR